MPRRQVIDQRGQLLRAAVGFAGCSMPSYDRALHAMLGVKGQMRLVASCPGLRAGVNRYR
jgi:hypothetical protein